MDKIDKQCTLLKHQDTLKSCIEYQELDKDILKCEKDIMLQLDDKTAKLFLKYLDLVSKQDIISIDLLLK